MKAVKAPISHIEVINANRGSEIFGIKDGMILSVLRETANFFFLKPVSHDRQPCGYLPPSEIKVSKKTGRAVTFSNTKNCPTFNI